VPAGAEDELAVPAEQLRGPVGAVPGDDVVGVAGDHEGVARHPAEVDRRAEHLQGAADEPVAQVQVQEVRVQRRRQAGRVPVPEQDVERRRVLSQEVVVDPVVPDQVVGAEPGEHLGHVVARQDARPA
jgi:hypothetical protein